MSLYRSPPKKDSQSDISQNISFFFQDSLFNWLFPSENEFSTQKTVLPVFLFCPPDVEYSQCRERRSSCCLQQKLKTRPLQLWGSENLWIVEFFVVVVEKLLENGKSWAKRRKEIVLGFWAKCFRLCFPKQLNDDDEHYVNLTLQAFKQCVLIFFILWHWRQANGI